MSPAILLALAGIGAALVLSKKDEAPATPATPALPKDTPKDTGSKDTESKDAKADADARAKAEEDAAAARAEAEEAKAEADRVKAEAATAAELQPYKDALLYAASPLGKEPFRVQTIASSFIGKPIGLSILTGASNPKATRSDYDIALLMLGNEREQRMAKGLPLRNEILALKKALAAYGTKLFGAVTNLPDPKEKAIGKFIDVPEPEAKAEKTWSDLGKDKPEDGCSWADSFTVPFKSLPAKYSSANGKPIGPFVAKYALSPSAKNESMGTILYMLGLEWAARKGSSESDRIDQLMACVKAERIRRFGA